MKLVDTIANTSAFSSSYNGLQEFLYNNIWVPVNVSFYDFNTKSILFAYAGKPFWWTNGGIKMYKILEIV